VTQPLRTPAVAPEDLRRAAARFATGVALVTAPGGLALVVDSFISASLEPPLVAFAPSRASLTWRRMRATGRFGVSVLDAAHAGSVRRRARPGADRLAGLDLQLVDGVPVLRDALAALVCALEAEYAAGDHTIVLGRVLAIRHGQARPPLVFFDGGFGTIEPTRAEPSPGSRASGVVDRVQLAARPVMPATARTPVISVNDPSPATSNPPRASDASPA